MRRRDLARVAIGLLLAACGQRGPGAPATVTVRGSDTMAVLLRRWAHAYSSARVDVSGGGTGTGIAALGNGTTDVAAASRPMTTEERRSTEVRRGPIVESVVALDAVAVYVHAESPLAVVALEDVARVYRGAIDVWSDLGGERRRIARYSRENSSGTYAFFRERVLGGAFFAPDVQCLPGTAAVVRAVARDRYAIGYGGIASASGVRVLGLRASSGAVTRPTREDAVSGVYPLARPVFVYHAQRTRPEVTAFVTWLRSLEAQRLAEAAGFFAAEELS